MSKQVDKTELEKMLEQKLAEKMAAIEDEAVSADGDHTQEVEENDITSGTEADAAGDMDGATDAEAEAAALTQHLEERTAECEQMKDQMLRVRADFDNYRKRMMREMDQLRKSASANLILALLPALDNLERALAHTGAEDGFVEGVGLVYKQFQEALAAEGLEPIPVLHEVFDPNMHDALAAIPSDTVEAGRIVEEYERGYRLRDVILRPSRVIVSSGTPAEESAGDVTEQETESTTSE